MLASQIPAKFNIPFANNPAAGNSNPIPQSSQIGITGGAASLVDGFPPLCFVPVGAGGIPPWGRDFNGLFNQVTAWSRWQAAGGVPAFDSTFSAAIGGYPQGALISATGGITAGSPQGSNHLWLSTTDNNTANPDAVFNASGWLAVPAVIDSAVTYTVGGTGAQFADLLAATQYLRRFFITDNGQVTFQYSAGVFNYSTTVFIGHAQNNRIQLLGATMLAALPTTDAGYAVNGSSASTRATDAATNIAMLRTKFATELHFTNGGGLEIDGLMLRNIDSILFTGDRSVTVTNDGQGTAFACRGVTSSPLNGLAFYNFQFGFTFISGASVSWFGTAPIVSLYNANNGINANAGSFTQFNGPVMSMQNDAHGVEVDTNSGEALTPAAGTALYSEGNGGAGVNVSQGNFTMNAGHLYKNATYGLAAQLGSGIQATGSDFGTGGNANGTGPLFANDGTIVNVANSTNTAGSSPAVGTVGNNNSLITTT